MKNCLHQTNLTMTDLTLVPPKKKQAIGCYLKCMATIHIRRRGKKGNLNKERTMQLKGHVPGFIEDVSDCLDFIKIVNKCNDVRHFVVSSLWSFDSMTCV